MNSRLSWEESNTNGSRPYFSNLFTPFVGTGHTWAVRGNLYWYQYRHCQVTPSPSPLSTGERGRQGSETTTGEVTNREREHKGNRTPSETVRHERWRDPTIRDSQSRGSLGVEGPLDGQGTRTVSVSLNTPNRHPPEHHNVKFSPRGPFCHHGVHVLIIPQVTELVPHSPTTYRHVWPVGQEIRFLLEINGNCDCRNNNQHPCLPEG